MISCGRLLRDVNTMSAILARSHPMVLLCGDLLLAIGLVLCLYHGGLLEMVQLVSGPLIGVAKFLKVGCHATKP